MGLAARLAELRQSRKESFQDVATAVGVTKTHIWELERGRTTNPSLGVLRGLADHFGVTISWLVGEDTGATDADPDLSRMFRLAADLDQPDREVIDDMIQSFLRRRKQRDAPQP